MRLRQTLAIAASLLCLPLAPAAAQTVGVTAAVNQAARSIRPNTAIRTIALGDNVINDERIETDKVGLLQILLADGTTFTVGPNSALAIDRFVYDPQAGTAKVAATLTKGVFRFIGGKTSKTPGGVSLGTPVGTIGIRGAVVDVNLDDGPGGRNMPTHVDMIFGDEVTLTAPNGRTDRIYEPGYSIVITAGADGTQSRSVQRTPPGFASAIQQSLAGGPGTSGGSPNRPSDGIVVASRIAGENSDLTPRINNPPIPLARPEPDRRDGVEASVIQEAQLDVGRDRVEETGGGGGGSGSSGSSGSGNSGGGGSGAPEAGRAIPLRLLTAGTTYVTNGGDAVSDPGAYGLVGGSPAEDRRVVLQVPESSRQGTAETDRGTLVLPVYASPTFTTHLVSAADGASLGGIPLAGRAYADAEGFTAYVLGLAGDPRRPVYALAGTPTADTGVLRNNDIRTYSYTLDPIQGLPVPFLDAAAIGTDFTGASIGNFYLLERPGDNPASTLLQSWLLVQGQGVAQKSAVGVNIGALLPSPSGSLGFDFGRRGSFRYDPLGFSSEFSGSITSLGLAAGGNEIFGKNGQNLVLMADTEANDYFRNAEVFGGSTPVFSTFHVLALQDEKPRAQFSAERGATRQLQQIRGYASGLIESYGEAEGYDQLQARSGASPNGVVIDFQPGSDTLGGEIEIGSRDGSRVTHVAFGSGIQGNASGGRSAYVDDDLFAASNNGNEQRTFAVRNQTTYRQVRDVNARTYLLSGDANRQPGLLPNGRLCDCQFLEWGWWGTQIRSSANPSRPNSEQFGTIRTAVHLGAWVAGDIATSAAVSALAGTTATYQGNAIGNVSQSVPGGLADYVASGGMNMSYDFGARSGNLSITGFDGRNFSAPLTADSGNAALFSGSLVQNGGDASGAAQGAFVNNGAAVAAGVIGNFDLRSASGGWESSGVFAGARPPGP